ncbi:lantibiotic dehydratase [Chitinophaga vietnamensis]|uniref:lantibiotic dehydratase n=1 Tax=Chitinophaga vietnamensis TaxID=2593957 RepID=UPI00117856CC|nr:lantibiotic dehydratase [Chitinophaga vietnamensis]
MALSHKGFFLLRTPLYPVTRYREVLQDSLSELAAAHPLFLYALCIASKDLLRELERAIADPAAFNQKKLDKLRRSLYKYWVRACTRSTPYGIFAGCTTGAIAGNTVIQLQDITAAHQHVRLDMDYFTKICDHIQQLPEVKPVLRYSPNNSIYPAGNKYRYAEYTIQHNYRKYLLTSVEDSVFMEKILGETRAGSTVAEIVQMILSEDDTIAQEEAEAFVEELIQSQLLIPDISPQITGPDQLQALISRLSSVAEAEVLYQSLCGLQQLLRQQDFARTRLNSIQQMCETLFPLEAPKDLLQVDLFKTAHTCTLSEKLVSDITTQVNRLLSICHGYTKSQSEMSNFAARFREQYESREMPLSFVLDAETGIGYGGATEQTVHTPFVEDVSNGPATENATVSWSALQQLCLDKYETFLKEGGGTVYITDEDLQKLGDPETVNMANSCYLFGTVLAASAEAADNGDYQFAMQSMGGPSAANLLGRFCSGDPVLAAKLAATLEEEAAAHPDAILAEVVHYPEARAANVLIRPALRPYEIPYISVPAATADHQIPVSDLLVSVRGNDVILRSKRLNKRVMPRLSSAHNYSFNSLPVYKFLCDLQHQSVVSHLSWDWGVLASRQRLPRVVYKNIILARAGWTLTFKEVEQLGEAEAALLSFFTEYRSRHAMPALVLLAEADNELLIDLTQPASIQVLMEHLRSKGHAKLKEFINGETEGLVRDAQNNVYAHELLLPLTCMPAAAKTATMAAPRRMILDGPMRSFTPGSEWLFVKIYCGFKTGEELLAGYFAAQLPEWQEDGLFEQFFFLRFGDPQPHIRIRFLNSAHPANNDVILHRIAAAMQPFIASGQVSKVQCDTYVREIERYGAETIMYCEQLFMADSQAVLGIISMLDGAEGEAFRWKLALRGAGMLLEDFGLSISERKNLLAALRESFITEFGGAKLQHKALNDKYRKHQQEIQSFMQAADDEKNEITEAIEMFQARSAVTAPLAEKIQSLCRDENRYRDIVASHLHMFLNRIFVAKQRKHELVIYFFLEKYYLSQLAMAATIR